MVPPELPNPIEQQTEAYSEAAIYERLHPFVREWFQEKFGSFSPPQRYSIINIKEGINTLISSPTGSGKTLSAFLAILDNLVTHADKGQLDDRVYAIYLSPLKALANDIDKNLKEPLKEINEIAKKYGRTLTIRVATRTGDTTPSQKQKMLTQPPHILITTPESLAISLATKRFSGMIAETEYVIIDEIHSLADNKRGVHMSLSLEQLEDERHATKPVTRIGLSATVRPLEAVATFLTGYADPDLEWRDANAPEKKPDGTPDDGRRRGLPRPCRIIDVQFIKELDLKVLSPVPDLINTSHAKMQDAMYGLLHDLIQTHSTTLIFTNTRAGTERVVHNLRDRYPRSYTGILDAEKEEAKIEREEEAEKKEGTFDEEFSTENGMKHGTEDVGTADVNAEDVGSEVVLEGEKKQGEKRKGEKRQSEKRRGEKKRHDSRRGYIGAHHGSLSKRHRLDIENRLKRGELKAVVCSTSLELGIDIGYVDLVVLLGSPKGVARALQRIGRSGHKLHDTAKGRIIVLNRDDLVECAVLLKAAIEKKIDKIQMPKNALDVLAQQIYGLAIEKKRMLENVFTLVRRAAPYQTLDRATFMKVIEYLAGEYVQLEGRSVYGKIWYDKETGMIGRRGKLARLIYMTNVGTIPDETNIKVKLNDLIIGTITEDFLERLKPGDVFVLGGEAYEFRYTRGLSAFVKTSLGKPPTVPQWVSEMLPLSFDLAVEIQTFRRYMEEMLELQRKGQKTKKDIMEYIDSYLYVDKRAVEAIYRYFHEQHSFASVPHRKRLVIEQFRDGNVRYAIFHTLYGRRVNDVLSRAMAFAHGRMSGRDVEMGINDNGFYLKSTTPIAGRRLLSMVKSDELDSVMSSALEKSEVLRMRFRHCAVRALMILRNYKGQRKSVGKQQMGARILLAAARRIGDDFPVLREARREVLEDLMDIINARQVLAEVQAGGITVEEIAKELPSPFAFNLVLQGYTDLLKMEDKVAFLKRMHSMVLEKIGEKPAPAPAAATGVGRSSDAALTPEGLAEVQANGLVGVELKKKQGKARFEAPAIEFSYDRLWEKQGELERKKQEDYNEYLHELMYRSSRKVRMERLMEEEGHRLIDGEGPGECWEDFVSFVNELLSGTVPKAWPDDLVKFFREKVPDLRR